MRYYTSSQLKKHEEQYIHIPRPAIFPFIGLIIFSILSYLNLKIIDWNVIKIIFYDEEVIRNIQLNSGNLINIYPLLGEYILISLSLISLIAIFIGGYRSLKSSNEAGLIDGLIIGLLIGLIGGLIGGLIIGLIDGLITRLIGGLIGGLIDGLLIGLIGGLIGGLIDGLAGEFSE